MILQCAREKDLCGENAAIEVILAQHGAEDFAFALVGSSGENLHFAAQQVAVLDVQHGAAAAHLTGIDISSKTIERAKENLKESPKVR